MSLETIYQEIRNDKEHFLFNELFFIDRNNQVIEKPNKKIKLLNGLPFVYEASELSKSLSLNSIKNQLTPSNEPSPFTSKGYLFSKELSFYGSYKLGRAFFSDGNVKKLHAFYVFDQIQFFKNLFLKDEPIYYKQKEVPLTIYTTDNSNDLNDKYNRIDLEYDEIAVFINKQDNIKQVLVKINLGDSLLKLSKFKDANDLKNSNWFLENDDVNELLSSFSSKKMISILNKNNEIFDENVEHITKLFSLSLNGYWSKDKEGKLKITKANLGEMVYFHLTAEGIKDNTEIVLQLEEDDGLLKKQETLFKRLNSNKKVVEQNINKKVFIKNKHATVSLYLDELWADMIEKDLGKEIELIWKAYSKTFEKRVESDELNVGYSKRHLFLKPAYENYSLPELLTNEGEAIIFALSDFAKEEVKKQLIETAGKLAENYRYNLAVRVLKSGKIATNIGEVYERKKAIYTYNVFTNEGKELTLKKASNFGFKNKYVNNGKLVTSKGISQIDYFTNIGLKNNVLKTSTDITKIWDIFDLEKVLFKDDFSDIPMGYFGNPVSFAYALLNEFVIKPTIQDIKNDWNKGLEEDFETIYKPKGLEACKAFAKSRTINSPIEFLDIFTPTLQKLLKNEFLSIDEIDKYNSSIQEKEFIKANNKHITHTVFFKYVENKYDLDDDAFINCIFINDKLLNF
jgi:hypothetical protein